MPQNDITLSKVITIDHLPEFLHFPEDGLNVMLDKIHYKNLRYSKVITQMQPSTVWILLPKDIGIDLPFGLSYILNSDANGNTGIHRSQLTCKINWKCLHS